MSKKIFTSLGLMSGTSMDGVDLSIIQSDGINEFELILNEYCEFDKDLFLKLLDLRDKLYTSKDLAKNFKNIIEVERNFTLFISKLVNSLVKKKIYNFRFNRFPRSNDFTSTKRENFKTIRGWKPFVSINKN